MVSLNIARFNTRGTSETTKRKATFPYLRDRKVDIALLQETHSTPKKEKIWRNEWGGSIFFSHGETNSKGVCILTKNKHFKVSKLSRDGEGRVLFVEFEVNQVLLSAMFLLQMRIIRNFSLNCLKL